MTPGRFRRLVVLVGALSLVPAIAGAAQDPPKPAPAAIQGSVVGVDGVNIRACPRPDCAVRAVALLGERITITGQEVDGFLPVDWGGATGFAYGLYIATPDHTPELSQGTPGCNRVALIFNVGVGYDSHLQILDALKAKNIPATVFAMGWWATEHPDLLKRIDAAGFPIGSHGDQRLELTKRGDDAVKQDIGAASAAIERAIGEAPQPYFTAYAAAMDERVRGLIARAGYLPVAYTLPADDWDFGADPNVVFEHVVPNISDGAIVEFHLDAPASAKSTAVALPWIIDRLQAKGYHFVTVPEMAQPCP